MNDSKQMSNSLILQAERLAFGGEAIAHDEDGRVVLLEGLAPGDRAQCEITFSKKRFARAKVVQVLERGEHYREPLCSACLQNGCEGCPWQMADHVSQLEALRSHLEHLFGISCEMHAIPPTFGWRSTVRLHFQNGKLGFYRKNSHEICEFDVCPVMSAEVAALFSQIKSQAKLLKGEGTLRITAAPGSSSGTIASDIAINESLVSNLLAQNLIHGAIVAGKSYGDPVDYFERDGSATIETPAGAFVQAHQPGNAALVKEVVAAVREIAEQNKQPSVQELYAGSGNFTFPMLEAGLQVTAVERDQAAVQSLQAKAKAHGFKVNGICGDAGLQSWDGAPVLLLDPPRTGDPNLVARVKKAKKLQRIVYVSCHPATLQRDIKELQPLGFHLTRIAGFDLFPHTGHLETLAVLSRK